MLNKKTRGLTMKAKIALSEELQEKKAWIEKTFPLRDIESLSKFFNVSPVTILDLKHRYPKMPCEQTPDGFYCTDVIEMLRFWVAYTRAKNAHSRYPTIVWYEYHTNFGPFMKDIPPIDSYR
jgi:hypothetical protein